MARCKGCHACTQKYMACYPFCQNVPAMWCVRYICRRQIMGWCCDSTL